MSVNPSQPQPSPTPRRNPGQIARLVGEYSRAFAQVIGWGTLAAFALAVGYLALRVAWWVVQYICTAMSL